MLYNIWWLIAPFGKSSKIFLSTKIINVRDLQYEIQFTRVIKDTLVNYNQYNI